MVNIKVTHKNTVRRFVLPTHNATWTDLEAKLRGLYNIPTSTFFTLSYVDEDDDVITLSTDTEFQEVLSSQISAPYIKFDLKFSTGDSSDGEDSNNEAWVFEGNITSTTNQEAQFIKIGSEESSIIKPISLFNDELTSSTKKTFLVDENETFENVEKDDEDDEEKDDREDKGKHKEVIGESSSNYVSSSMELNQPSPLQDQDNQVTVAELAEQFQKMLDQFKKQVVKDHKLAGNMMDQFLRSLVEKYIQDNQSQDNLQEEESQDQGKIQDNIQSREMDFFNDHSPLFNSRRQSQDQSQQRGHDPFFDEHPPLFNTHQVSTPLLPGSFPVAQKSTPCPWAGQARPETDSLEMRQNVRGSGHRSQKHREGRREGRREEAREEVREETREEADIFSLAMEPIEQIVSTEPTEPDVTSPYYEEIKTLNDMGFWRDEDQYLELLTLYTGNLDRVIEVLLERQEQ
ncbi:1853_t:CDS:2 [Funneliformis geosporum]|nr:1853_t:CDS:2 [Funneliformis geosporum]